MGVASKSNYSYSQRQHETPQTMERLLLQVESQHEDTGNFYYYKKSRDKFIRRVNNSNFGLRLKDPIHRRTRELILFKEQLEKQVQDCRQEQQMRAAKNLSTPSRLPTLH